MLVGDLITLTEEMNSNGTNTNSDTDTDSNLVSNDYYYDFNYFKSVISNHYSNQHRLLMEVA